MAYRLGVDVGGTFTDLVLVDDAGKTFHVAKVPSTYPDASLGIISGIERICATAGIDPRDIHQLMHGTTVATNAVLTGEGSRVGLVTTAGYRYILQIARSFIPGGLGAWVNFNMKPPLAPLSLTIEADERIDASGNVVLPLDETGLIEALRGLRARGIDALAVSLIHSYANDAHERRVAEIAAVELPDVAISLSSQVVPEMQEYERTITTVANAYVGPTVGRYVRNFGRQLTSVCGDIKLNILRSDGGLTSTRGAESSPVNLLMSGPAGGVAGAIWTASQAGYRDFLTFDMGGTSTDVCLVRNGEAEVRRETMVGELSVRASSIDTRTVGAGGGSIAHVPELTRALRVGPQSAGSAPGPAAYGKGGTAPTVTDANVVLGYLPMLSRLGGDMKISRELAIEAVGSIAKALNFDVERAAQGIYDIVNENMVGALRLVSVQKGFDPRRLALVAFGGAGPLHANAVAALIGCWPVIVPPGPGVLCALGDATTSARDEAARSFHKRFRETDVAELERLLDDLAARASRGLDDDGISCENRTLRFEADVRYSGQVLNQTIPFARERLAEGGLASLAAQFDDVHRRLYTFALDADHEFINLRAIAESRRTLSGITPLPAGGPDPSPALIESAPAIFERKTVAAPIYDRSRLEAGNVVNGPAIVTQLDSTTLILPRHEGSVDPLGNIIIRPTRH
ncbi:MAG: hydantoinase/oxoprolinase family protein [Parvibaculaceae bacterium]